MRARGAQAQTGTRARRASKDRRARARCASKAREHYARAHFGHARAQISSPKVDLVSLFAIWRAYLRARRAYLRTRILALLVHLARAPLFARASRARACRCSRTSRAHVLNARALALRTPQLSPIHAPPILSCPATGSYPSITVNEPALPPLVKRTSSCGFLQVFSFFIVHISYSFATRLNRQVSGFLLLSLLW